MKQQLLPDLSLTIPALLILSLGTLVIFSSSPQLALYQLIFGVIGFGLFWFLSYLEPSVYSYYVWILYVAVIVLLLIVFILGFETRGSLRWIPLGPFNFQPSEFAKPILIVTLAHFWNTHSATWKNIGLSLAIFAPIFVLIFKQPDLGTSLTLSAIWLAMLFASDISFAKISLLLVAALAVLPLSWYTLHDYQRDRILSFMSPDKDPLGVGYNVIQSTIAVGSGQMWGRGLGHGTQSRLQFLPEFRTDFIFASIAEEFGFLGATILFTLFTVIIVRALILASRNRNRLGILLIFGVLGMFIFQIIVNIGMNIGIMPITGITLPLVSYGGSSLISTLASLGLIASVSRFSSERTEYD
jgi:rod shape determining protein RodA